MTCCPKTHVPHKLVGSSEFKPVAFKPAAGKDHSPRVLIRGGVSFIGTSRPYIRADGESPLRRGLVDSYYMAQASVTNAEFAAFIEQTGYITEAEHLGWSFVFYSQLPDDGKDMESVPGTPWWKKVYGASWHSLSGPNCSLVQERQDHPVVHISWNDANAYCSWVGGRLPSEIEWEHAARGKLGDVIFPWGNTEPSDDENFLCNIWQGHFPNTNTVKDGYVTTAPALSYNPNGFDLYNMVGNVWEWTADEFRTPAQRKSQVKNKLQQQHRERVAKGGSFLCHKSYCYRYRIAARIGNTMDSTTTHTGFRVVWDC